MQASGRQRIALAALVIDDIGPDEVRALLQSAIDTDQRVEVVFVNAHCVTLASRNSNFRDSMNRSDVCLPDGAGTVLGLRLLGYNLRHRVIGGRRWLRLVCSWAAQNGWRVAVAGGPQGTATRAASKLAAQFPGLAVQGYEIGFIDPDAPIETWARNLGAEILFLGIGPPRQELWISRRLQHLDVNAAIAVGYTLVAIAEDVVLPYWIADLGLEWLLRLSREPRRLWRRYLVGIPYFMWIVARAKLSHPRPNSTSRMSG